MSERRGAWRRITSLTVGGALGFWVANFAISLTPIAADYRAGVGIAYAPMLLEALAGGLVVGLCVSYCLVRFYGALPTSSPTGKALALSFVALVVLTALIEVPSKLLTPGADAVHLFLVAGSFNVLRIAALGLVIGWLYRSGSPEHVV